MMNDLDKRREAESTLGQLRLDHQALRVELARVTEASEGWKRAAESQNRQWSAKCTELTEARAETERLRERVAELEVSLSLAEDAAAYGDDL